MAHEHSHTRVNLAVFVALLVLVAATVFVARFDMGKWNFIVAVSIAFAKSVLIVFYFMHVRESGPLTKIVVVAGLLWLAILFTFSLADYWTRDLLT